MSTITRGAEKKKSEREKRLEKRAAADAPTFQKKRKRDDEAKAPVPAPVNPPKQNTQNPPPPDPRAIAFRRRVDDYKFLKQLVEPTYSEELKERAFNFQLYLEGSERLKAEKKEAQIFREFLSKDTVGYIEVEISKGFQKAKPGPNLDAILGRIAEKVLKEALTKLKDNPLTVPRGDLISRELIDKALAVAIVYLLPLEVIKAHSREEKKQEREEKKQEEPEPDDNLPQDDEPEAPAPAPRAKKPKVKQYTPSGFRNARQEEKKINENIEDVRHYTQYLWSKNSSTKKFLADERGKYCKVAAEILANCRWGKTLGRHEGDDVAKSMRILKKQGIISKADLEGEGGRKKTFIMDRLAAYEREKEMEPYVSLPSNVKEKLKNYTKSVTRLYR